MTNYKLAITKIDPTLFGNIVRDIAEIGRSYKEFGFSQKNALKVVGQILQLSRHKYITLNPDYYTESAMLPNDFLIYSTPDVLKLDLLHATSSQEQLPARALEHAVLFRFILNSCGMENRFRLSRTLLEAYCNTIQSGSTKDFIGLAKRYNLPILSDAEIVNISQISFNEGDTHDERIISELVEYIFPDMKIRHISDFISSYFDWIYEDSEEFNKLVQSYTSEARARLKENGFNYPAAEQLRLYIINNKQEYVRRMMRQYTHTLSSDSWSVIALMLRY